MRGANAVVGTLTTTDADALDTHTYTLVTGDGSTDNASFTIAGDELQANSQLAAGTYAVRIRTTDNDDGTFEEAFTITVVDDMAPSFTNGTPTASDVTKSGLTLTVQLDEAGTVYYVVVADGAAATERDPAKSRQ
ncbi:hypothetical protein ACFSS9_19410 [Paenibacillus septentrionalis]|uniref:hypothetical protein n=1 Tax=Paenibacillus septentrionalis TaxID=429342 RepID=UPI003645063C